MTPKASCDLPALIVGIAQRLAEQGGYRTWRALQTRIIQMGYAASDAEAALSGAKVRRELNALCQTHLKRENRG